MALVSLAMQTRKPDKINIYDDSKDPVDIRSIEALNYCLLLLQEKQIPWEVIYGQKKGQHYNDNLANKAGYDLVWRFDDDNVADIDTLEKLEAQMVDGVGAVGGSILTPPLWESNNIGSTINDLTTQNEQWFKIKETKEVDHLHNSFLYRAGIVNFHLGLSNKSFRGETMFTYSLKLAGYKILITPAITWHFKSTSGGTRTNVSQADYEGDDKIFREWLDFTRKDKKLILLDSGLGDHIVFSKVLPDIKKKYRKVLISCCYPEVFEGEEIISIAEGERLENKENHDLYKFMEENNWEEDLESAYRKLYAA
jgi:hypothetical protein